jgi:hypothetical protein
MFVVMVQHQSPELRRRVLPKLKANVDAGQADAADYAMVYDRAAREEGRKQSTAEPRMRRAGRAAARDASEDEAHVDSRRARSGSCASRSTSEW